MPPITSPLTPSTAPTISIGQYLIDRLYEAGLRRLYGVPGDFNLEFLELLEKDGRIAFIGTCNELNGGYAADGDARLSGFGALITTYGVGDLSALQAIAGAYAERVPVLSLAGAPPLHAIETRALVHHTLLNGDYDNMLQAHAPFTTAQARLTPDNAGVEIDRVVSAVIRRKLPGYLQLPSDITTVMIPAPSAPLALAQPAADPETLTLAADYLAKKIENAKSPVILVDSLVSRFGLAEDVTRFIEKTGIPFALTSPGKGSLPESSPYYLGGYAGGASAPALFERVAASDCVIGLGVRFSDLPSGYFTQKIQPDAWINLNADSVRVNMGQKERVLVGAGAASVLKATLQRLSGRAPLPAPAPRKLSRPETDEAWNGTVFWNRIQTFLREGDAIAADSGTSAVALTGMTLPDNVDFVIQPVWSAIGYTCPALMGMAMAQPERRSLLFIGDGALQMTAQEISTMLRNGLSPVLFVINNRGYTVERCILGVHAAFNDIADWDYTALPRAFGPNGKSKVFSVRTRDELEKALSAAEKPDGLVLIEIHLGPMDVPPGMMKFGEACNRYDYSRTL